MKPIVTSIAAAALAAALAAPASAEPFNGPFVGVQAGWTEHGLAAPPAAPTAPDLDRSRESLSGGVYAGYDARLGSSFVVGAEAGFQLGIDDAVRSDVGTTSFTINPKHAFDLTARAGYLLGENTLVYARGGYANVRVGTETIDGAGIIRTGSAHRDGWLVGGGLEQAVSDQVSARAEYRYSDLGKAGGKFDRHQVLVGLSYRF